METESSSPSSQEPSIRPSYKKNSVHALLPHFFKIRFNTILPSNTRSSKLSPSYGFPIKILHAFLSSLFVSHTLPIRLKKAFTFCNKTNITLFHSLWLRIKQKVRQSIFGVFYENCCGLFTCPQHDRQMKWLLTKAGVDKSAAAERKPG
jgi:hypothetical protein